MLPTIIGTLGGVASSLAAEFVKEAATEAGQAVKKEALKRTSEFTTDLTKKGFDESEGFFSSAVDTIQKLLF